MAFEDFYREHREGVFRFLYARTHQVEVSEDLTQDTFLCVLPMFPRLQPGNLRAYLLTTAYHLLISYHKKQQLLSPLPDELSLPHQEQVRKPGVVEEVLAALGEDAQYLVMHVVCGSTGQELAQHFQVSRHTVFARLQRARKRFQAEYEQRQERGTVA